MIKRVILLLFILSASPVMAEDKVPSQPVPEDKKDLAESLDAFIERAVDDGLLTAPGAEVSSEANEIAVDETPAGLPEDCTPIQGADFAGLSKLRKFSDLYGDPTDENSAENSDGIKERLALGLYSEAQSLLKQAGLQNSYLYELSVLLESRAPADATFFEALQGCGDISEFWYAVALLSNHNHAGAQPLERAIKTYRALPFQMRIDVATIVVPALDSHEEHLLARKLLADFTPEEIASSASLQFNLALLDEEAESKINDFIIRPEFRRKALGAILQRGSHLTSAQRELLLEEVSSIIENETDEHQLTIALKFSLKEFGKRSSISEMMALAKLPKLQTPAAKNTILQSVAKVIEKDLESENQLVVLSSFQDLIDYAFVLDNHPGTAHLYPLAARRAKAMGYISLASRLANEDLRRVDALLQEAEVAMRQGDDARVHAIAHSRPDIPEITFLAATAALLSDDQVKLKAYEARLHKSPELALSLIQEDAASGKWLVSESTYLAAGSTPDITIAAQAASLLALRKDAKASLEKPSVRLSEIDEILSRSAADLGPVTKEVN